MPIQSKNEADRSRATKTGQIDELATVCPQQTSMGVVPCDRPYHIFLMCGRYASFLPAEFIARLFATVNPLPNLAPTWNMAPTMDAPVVRLVDGERHLNALKWGLVPYFTKDLKKARKPINARSETIAKSGMFKAAFAEPAALCRPPPTTNGGTIQTARRRSPWRASTAIP